MPINILNEVLLLQYIYNLNHPNKLSISIFYKQYKAIFYRKGI
ncbi:hypothetical protein CNEO4_270095 [Clostridium neonatale]|nr:hypothetical protein CNEO4_270095 [Clostridium neonatale]CAI3688933.1 hypothetical protein CNEO3_50098 [Clostridium neonatale]